MTTLTSLADITYAQGLQRLAMRKQALDSGLFPRMSAATLAKTLPLLKIGTAFMKQAAEGGLLGSLKSGIGSIDPNTQRMLLGSLSGAGLGALGGLGSAALSSSPDKSYLRRALAGATLGGIGGGGLAAALGGSAPVKREQPKIGQRAQAVLAGTPAQRARDLSALQSDANSIAPEIGAAIGGGLAIGVPGAGAAYLANRGEYDPNVIARHLSGLKTEMSKAPKKQVGNFVPKPKGLEGASSRALAQLYGEADHLDVLGKPTSYHLGKLPKQTFVDSALGRAPRELSHMLPSVLTDDAAPKLLERSSVKGFTDLAGKIKLPKSLAAGALGAVGLGGLGLTGLTYLRNAMERQSAKSTLNDLSNYARSSGE